MVDQHTQASSSIVGDWCSTGPSLLQDLALEAPPAMFDDGKECSDHLECKGHSHSALVLQSDLAVWAQYAASADE